MTFNVHLPFILRVALYTPAHSVVGKLLSYSSVHAIAAGSLVQVTLGKSKSRLILGVVWQCLPYHACDDHEKVLEIKPIVRHFDGFVPLTDAWRQLIEFSARYYQRSIGEMALAALPAHLKKLTPDQVDKQIKKCYQLYRLSIKQPYDAAFLPSTKITHSDEQKMALAQLANLLRVELPNAEHENHFNRNGDNKHIAIKNKYKTFVLYGTTGSGKTEVYLSHMQHIFEQAPHAQILFMVPEINLTPQFEERLRARFEPILGQGVVVSLNSALPPALRLKNWLSAHLGLARIVLGTRMAIFTNLPKLALIVVDEEHDASYKSQDGARYSARDLAIFRGKKENIPVVLGSATPSLETWYNSMFYPIDSPKEFKALQKKQQIPPKTSSMTGGLEGSQPRYERITMHDRIGGAVLPQVKLVNLKQQAPKTLVAPELLQAIKEGIVRGEQSLLLLNRRGYAPVLSCSACDWKSQCPNCSAYRVFHKFDKTLRCHHCAMADKVPYACPSCGNLDIYSQGIGTEQIQEYLMQTLSGMTRADGSPIQIGRIDADTTKLKGDLQSQLIQVSTGEIDVLVGTQMVAKGHDFRRMTLVAALNPDGALFASDFRASERLFSLLMQAAGRAGRDVNVSRQSQMWVQTHHPEHPVYQALIQHDYSQYATQLLLERKNAMLPPFSFLALLRTDAKTQEAAQAFLENARQAVHEEAACYEFLQPYPDGRIRVQLYGAVPLPMQRVANVERAQLLIESSSRPMLTEFLQRLQKVLHNTKSKNIIRWMIEVDPIGI